MSTEALPKGLKANQRLARTRAFVLENKLGARLRDFLVHGVIQVRVLKKAYPGLMHLLIFWGVTIQLVGTAISLVQIPLFVPFLELPFPRSSAYLIFELVMDLAGGAILLGAFLAVFRRLFIKPDTLESRWDDYYALALLFLIPIVGFLVEGLRFVAAEPPWAGWSPIGLLTARLLAAGGVTKAAAVSLHYPFYWTHILVGLLFVASIPFTKLRHLVTAPLNIVLKPRRRDSVLETIPNIEEAELLGVGQINEFSSQQLLSFDACLRCGRCDEACPSRFSGMPLSPRVLIQDLRSAMTTNLMDSPLNGDRPSFEPGISAETFWSCTTCGACASVCPVFVNPITEIIDLRRYQVLTTGDIPKTVAEVLRNMERQGNPWGMPPQDRTAWAEGLDVPVLQPGGETDILLYMGCAAAYDTRNRKVARALVELLNQNGVDFAILGDDEACCGETARRLGHEYLFQVSAEENIKQFGTYKFNKIVTQCPHCFNTIKNEYPPFGGDFEVQHYTELLASLEANGDRQQPSSAPDLGAEDTGDRFTYHDSCYLARYNQISTAPRALLDSAGVERVEMDRRLENGFCCGGGGGQMWLETDPDTRINQRRLDEALSVGADVVATACPYCLIMFDDAIRSKGLGEKIEVMDIAEVLLRKSNPAE